MERLTDIAIETQPDNGNGHGSLQVGEVQEISLYRLLLRKRWYLARSSALAMLLFAAIAFLLPPQYESLARLMPPDHNESLMLAALSGRMSDSGLGMVASSLLGLRSSGALFVGIMGSNSVEDEMIRKFDLRKVYSTKRWESARKRLESNTDMTEDRKNGIITIRIRDKSKERAQQLCAAYVDELNRLVSQLSTSSARREREFLESRLQAVKIDLDEASRQLSVFSSKNTAIDLPQQGKAMVEAAAILQGQLIAAESQRKGLRQMYGPEHVRVKGIEAQIGELRRQLQNMGGTDEQLASGRSETFYPPIRKLPLLAVTYTDLYRRAKIQEAVFETLTKQYELAKVQEVKDTPTVRVLDQPSFPEHKVSPHRTLIALSGMLVGLAFGIAMIVGRLVWRKTGVDHPKKIAAVETWNALHEDWAAVASSVRRRANV